MLQGFARRYTRNDRLEIIRNGYFPKKFYKTVYLNVKQLYLWTHYRATEDEI